MKAQILRTHNHSQPNTHSNKAKSYSGPLNILQTRSSPPRPEASPNHSRAQPSPAPRVRCRRYTYAAPVVRHPRRHRPGHNAARRNNRQAPFNSSRSLANNRRVRHPTRALRSAPTDPPRGAVPAARTQTRTSTLQQQHNTTDGFKDTSYTRQIIARTNNNHNPQTPSAQDTLQQSKST